MNFKFSENTKRKQILFIIVSSLVLIFSLCLEKMTQDFIDIPSDATYNKFAVIILVFLCLSSFNYMKRYLETYIEKRGNFEGQAIVYKNILSEGDGVLFRNGTGTTLYNVTEDIYEMLPWYSVGKNKLYIEFLGFIVLGSYMVFFVSIELGIITLILIGISILLANFLSKFVAMQMNQKQYANSELNQSIIETIKSISTIKQLGKLEYFGEKYNKYLDGKYKKIINRVIRSQALFIVQLVLSREVIPIIVLFVSVISSMFGRTTIGAAIVMMDLSMRVSKSVQAIGELLAQKHTADNIKQRIEKIVFAKQHTYQKDKAGKFKTLKVEVSSFSHELQENSILEGFSLEIRKGDICILKGKSGSGKSTIFESIARTLSTGMLKGKILYNDKDIDDIMPEDYYTHVLLVEQTTALIEGDLQENIMLGDVFPKQDVEEVIQVCGLKNFIIIKGENFVIEEDGKNVSGGEKQRIGLARFLLRKPELLLLDEVTSSLDKDTQDEVVRNVYNYVQKYNMTLLVISHNNDFDKYATKVITIN